AADTAGPRARCVDRVRPLCRFDARLSGVWARLADPGTEGAAPFCARRFRTRPDPHPRCAGCGRACPGRQALRQCRSLRAARSCLPRTLAARLPRDRRGRAEALCGHRCTGRSRKRASRRAGGRHRAARRRSQIMTRSQAREAAPEPAAPPPRANPDLLGHEAAEAELRRLFDSGRMPHALLLSGPRGIGKATLAFRLARFVLASGGGEGPPGGLFGEPGASGLAIAPDSGTFRRVASGGHADLLTVERAYDPRRRRLRGEIIVGNAREIGTFLRLTPAEGGWRVVVVDGADEMNRAAANALLKILEEPPRRTLLLLVAHSPGRLLPTIRSRCRRFPLAPLPPAIVRQLLLRYRRDLPEPQA